MCTHAYMHVYVYVRMYVWACTCICMCTCICLRVRSIQAAYYGYPLKEPTYAYSTRHKTRGTHTEPTQHPFSSHAPDTQQTPTYSPAQAGRQVHYCTMNLPTRLIKVALWAEVRFFSKHSALMSLLFSRASRAFLISSIVQLVLCQSKGTMDSYLFCCCRCFCGWVGRNCIPDFLFGTKNNLAPISAIFESFCEQVTWSKPDPSVYLHASGSLETWVLFCIWLNRLANKYFWSGWNLLAWGPSREIFDLLPVIL